MDAEALVRVRVHAPEQWQQQISPDLLTSAIDRGTPVQMVVMCADIRASAFIMKEAIDFQKFAQIINAFTQAVNLAIREATGWFDKFTGDGFLAYWVVGDHEAHEYAEEVLRTTRAILNIFKQEAEPQLRANCRNFPSCAGISIGIDGGFAYFANVAGELTIVGHPVVGAVRMVSTALPYEAIANVFVAEKCLAKSEWMKSQGITLLPTSRPTKEYPTGQVVYSLQYPHPVPQPWSSNQ